MRGKTHYDLHSKEIAERIAKTDAEILQSGKERILEEKGVSDKGEPAVFITHKRPLFNDSKVVGMVGFSLDITERKRLKRRLN